MARPSLLDGVQSSQLFTTSLASDVQSTNGVLQVGIMPAVNKKQIASLIQVKYQAEAGQVVTVTTSTSLVPSGSTQYSIEIGDTNRVRNGVQETLKRYTYLTPADVTTLGATAALQREAINVALIAKINADTAYNFVTAATLTGGTGFTVTDSTGYYPVNKQGMTVRQGASYVQTCRNADATGFVGNEAAITTVANYGFGIGSQLAEYKPIVDQMWGNLIQGYLGGTAPKTSAGAYATSGQNYDGFAIVGLSPSNTSTGHSQTAYVPLCYIAYVDNGTGTSTANLTGFLAFEREFQRAIADNYTFDAAAIYDFFDNGLIASATYPTDGTVLSTTDNKVMAAKSSGQKYDWYINPIGAHTILQPTVGTGGFQPWLDVTTQEGLELSPPNLTQNPKQFVVGKTEYSLFVRLDIGTGVAATDFKSLSIGFRKKAAYAVDQTAYEAASVATACLGVPLDTGAAPVINMITGPGTAGALTNTSCAVTPAANAIVDLYLTVDINGLVKFYVNGVDKTPLRASNYSFTTGLNIMPFISFRHGANVGATPKIIQVLALPSINWRVNTQN